MNNTLHAALAAATMALPTLLVALQWRVTRIDLPPSSTALIAIRT